MNTLLFALFSSVVSLPPLPSCPARSTWPGESWADNTALAKQTRADKIAAFEQYAFTLKGTDAERKGIRTDGVVIIQNGVVMYEKYARGWDASKRHISWSVAKSITSALTGVAVQQGKVSVEESFCTYLASPDSRACGVTLRHLLEFASGFDWNEGYEDESYQTSSPINMFFGAGTADIAAFVISHGKKYEPGAHFEYSTGDPTLLLSAVNRAMTKDFGKEWPWTKFFDVLGAKSPVIEGDLKGNLLGGSMMYLTARDYARIGYLYLNDGCWNGQRVLPEGWVQNSKVPSSAYLNSVPASTNQPNGWLWWLNVPSAPQGKTEKPWKDAPQDTITANGHWGQFIVVIPSLDVVMVRIGDDRDSEFSLNEFIKLGLEVLP